MKITKSQLRKIIKEEIIKEIGIGNLDLSPLRIPPTAEKYRKRIEGLVSDLDQISPLDPVYKHYKAGVKMTVEDILDNIEDENTKAQVEDMVAKKLGTYFIP